MTAASDKTRELITQGQQLAATIGTNVTAALDSPLAHAAHEKAQALLNTPPIQRAHFWFRATAHEATTPIRNWFVKNGMGTTYDEYIVPALTDGKVVRSLALAVAMYSLAPVFSMNSIANFGFFWKDMINNDINNAIVHIGWSIAQQIAADVVWKFGDRIKPETAANFFGFSRRVANKFLANPGFDELVDTLPRDAQTPTADLPIAKNKLTPADQVLNNTLKDFSEQSTNFLISNVANISKIGSSTYFLGVGLYTGSGSYLLAGALTASVVGLSYLRNKAVDYVVKDNERLKGLQESAFSAMRSHTKIVDEGRRQIAMNSGDATAEAEAYFKKWKDLNSKILNNEMFSNILNTVGSSLSRFLPFSYIVSTGFGVPAHHTYNVFGQHIDNTNIGNQVSAAQNTLNFADSTSDAWAIGANNANAKAAIKGLGIVVNDWTENRKPIALGGEKPQCDATQPVGLNVHNLVLKSSQNDITVDFAANPGERLLLSGLSARRKATLFNYLVGYFPNNADTLTYGGIDTLNGNLAVVLPQTKIQAPTLREALGVAAITTDTSAAITDILEKIGFAQSLDDDSKHILQAPDDAEAFGKIAPNLNAAQQQLLQLARIALQQSRFVILDEAFAPLNAEQIDRVCALFKDRLSQSVIVSLENAHPAPASKQLAQFYTDAKNYGPTTWSMPLRTTGGTSWLEKFGLRL